MERRRDRCGYRRRALGRFGGPQPDPNAVSLGLDKLQERGERFSREVLEHRRKTEGKRQEIERDADRLRSLRASSKPTPWIRAAGRSRRSSLRSGVNLEAVTTAASADAESLEERLARIEARQKTATR